MKSYEYIARDSSGARKQGLRDAASRNDVVSWLRGRGFTPVSVDEIAVVEVEQTRQKSRKKSVKSADLAALCWQLSTMAEGGIPITLALETIAEDTENLYLQEVLQQVLETIQKGETFSAAISEFPKVFNSLSCAMILAGETGGNLATALQRTAQYFENRDKLAKKVKGAMAYPVFVFAFILLMTIFIMAFIVPRFRTIFDQIGGELPAFTQGFMNFYDMLCNNIVGIVVTVLSVTISLVLVCRRTKKGHYLFSKIMLLLPLLGKIFSQAFVAMFCKTMSTLLGCGVPVLEVFDILAAMTNNDIIKGAITQARERLVEGSKISLGLSESGFFPNMVVKMIQVGEESGSLPTVLERTSSYYERKVDSSISTVMSLIEPIMIVTVAAIVLVVVLALYLPIFSMSDV